MEITQKALLRLYINNKKYEKYNEIMINEIKQIFSKKVQNVEKSFSYSSMVNLLEETRKNLTYYEAMIFQKFYNVLHEEDIEEDIKSITLTEIYEKIK